MKKIILASLFLLLILFVVGAHVDAQEKKIHYIRVNLTDIKLVLFENEKQIAVYDIAAPKRNWYQLPLEGQLKEIITRPNWYPTVATRKHYFVKKGVELPEFVGYGDPRNAMGAAKLIIQFNGDRVATIRIHGTNDPASIGKRISRGCIRMRNEDILDLIEKIKNSKTMVIIEAPIKGASLFDFKYGWVKIN